VTNIVVRAGNDPTSGAIFGNRLKTRKYWLGYCGGVAKERLKARVFERFLKTVATTTCTRLRSITEVQMMLRLAACNL